MKLGRTIPCIKTLLGVSQVKVKVTVAKNRKMVTVQELEIGMRDGHEF